METGPDISTFARRKDDCTSGSIPTNETPQMQMDWALFRHRILAKPGYGVLLVGSNWIIAVPTTDLLERVENYPLVTNNGYIVHKLFGSIGIYTINWYINETVCTLVALSAAST